MTVSVEVIKEQAFNLLSDMERLDLIRINTPVKNDTTDEKLSERFAGTLRLSNDKYNEYQNTLQEGRNEWRKNIY